MVDLEEKRNRIKTNILNTCRTKGRCDNCGYLNICPKLEFKASGCGLISIQTTIAKILNDFDLLETLAWKKQLSTVKIKGNV